MFGLYLDIQKQLAIDDLDDKEVKGRWKSFFNKWYEPKPTLSILLLSTDHDFG